MPKSKFFTEKFSSQYIKLNKSLKMRVDKSIQKILDNPELGKPLAFELHGFRSERIGPFRLIYEMRGDVVVFHTFEHRKKVYRK